MHKTKVYDLIFKEMITFKAFQGKNALVKYAVHSQDSSLSEQELQCKNISLRFL